MLCRLDNHRLGILQTIYYMIHGLGVFESEKSTPPLFLWLLHSFEVFDVVLLRCVAFGCTIIYIVTLTYLSSMLLCCLLLSLHNHRFEAETTKPQS